MAVIVSLTRRERPIEKGIGTILAARIHANGYKIHMGRERPKFPGGPEDFVGGILRNCIVRPINRDEFVRLCNSVKTSWWL